MLGRSAGLTEEQLRYLGDDPLPAGVYTEAEATIVRYARTSTLTLAISEELYADLERSFELQQIMALWAQVGLANMINRFHATFHTDVNQEIFDQAAAGDTLAGSCPIPFERRSLP